MDFLEFSLFFFDGIELFGTEVGDLKGTHLNYCELKSEDIEDTLVHSLLNSFSSRNRAWRNPSGSVFAEAALSADSLMRLRIRSPAQACSSQDTEIAFAWETKASTLVSGTIGWAISASSRKCVRVVRGCVRACACSWASG